MGCGAVFVRVMAKRNWRLTRGAESRFGTGSFALIIMGKKEREEGREGGRKESWPAGRLHNFFWGEGGTLAQLLKDHTWRCWRGPYAVLGIELESAPSKTGALSPVLLNS